jgi:cysteine synthase A
MKKITTNIRKINLSINRTKGRDTMHVAGDLSALIGGTPLLELNHLFPETQARLLAKCEFMNPMSIKDRPVLNMIRSAIKRGSITSDTEVVEASSGNTAIAIASLGAIMGFRVRVYMSDLCSLERRKILCSYGARVVITPGQSIRREQGAGPSPIARRILIQLSL